ncbi:MAG: response regulator [Cytophagales bacterium]
MNEKREILLIDDDATSNLINEVVIKKSNLFNSIKTVIAAESGLNYLLSKPDNLPEVIFLDINMPEMDGWEFLDKFAELDTEIRDKIDIYMLSSSQNPDDIIRAVKNPFVKDFLSKPLKLEMIKRKFE